VLGENNIHTVVAASPAICEDRAAKAARPATSKAGSLAGTFSRHGHADLLCAAGAWIDHTQSHLNRWWRTRCAAGLGTARVAAVTTMMAEPGVSRGSSLHQGEGDEAGAEEGGSKQC
jgi:hypothetical protein